MLTPLACRQFLFHPAVTAIRVLQFFLAASIFFYVTLMPADNAPSQYPDKLMHYIGNILLMGSAYVALMGKLRLHTIVIICCLLSLASELGQSFTATRTTDPADFLMNMLGIGTAYFFCRLIDSVLISKTKDEYINKD